MNSNASSKLFVRYVGFGRIDNTKGMVFCLGPNSWTVVTDTVLKFRLRLLHKFILDLLYVGTLLGAQIRVSGVESFSLSKELVSGTFYS